ncbi:hypothetical protein X773_04650 [Mesorhizobium sp. LSJC285A00]|nr:hypothetical protein X773_04650 [Mesorhizobium sp. LSJC285A00]
MTMGREAYTKLSHELVQFAAGVVKAVVLAGAGLPQT